MVAEAISDHPCFRTLDIEIRRGGVSYTIDTVKEIRSSFEGIEFHFIIGADMVNYLPKWEGIEELVNLMTFIGVGLSRGRRWTWMRSPVICRARCIWQTCPRSIFRRPKSGKSWLRDIRSAIW